MGNDIKKKCKNCGYEKEYHVGYGYVGGTEIQHSIPEKCPSCNLIW